MDVQVCVIGSGNHSKFVLKVRIINTDTVADVKRKISDQIGLSKLANLRLIFAGSELKNDQSRLNDLSISAGSVMHALVCEIKESAEVNEARKTVSDNTEVKWKSQFYVFCKETSCNSLQPGKLRVRCSSCGSSGLLLQYEPSCWNDVMHNRIPCQCLENHCENSYVTFYFKCVQCASNNEAAPLSQVKSNSSNQPCVICDETKNPVIVFLCPKRHIVCINCFVIHGIIKLEERDFVLSTHFGYTLMCPAGCADSFIVDPHHFRLLGSEMYEKYQRLSAEMYLLGKGGIYCPNPKCGAGFIRDTETGTDRDLNVTICPECKFSFCRSCRQRASECYCKTATAVGTNNSPRTSLSDDMESSEMKSYVTVQAISKPCPRCRAPTFKDGGCNHINCIVCRFPWCWICLDQWKDDCQWNHWFDSLQ